MVTTASPSPSPKDETTESEPQTIAEKGFFGQIVQSIFEVSTFRHLHRDSI